MKLNEQDIVEISGWEDMENDPLFVSDVDPEAVSVGRVIGHYPALLPMKPCNISSCHTEHGKGWYVELKTGERTYIGNVCGNKHFPELKHQTKVFKRVNDRKLVRIRVARCISLLETLTPKINDFLNKEGRIVYRAMAPFLNAEIVPRDLVSELKNRLKSNESDVTFEQKRSMQDREDYKIINPAARGREVTHKQVKVGNLIGLKALDTHHIQALVNSAANRIKTLQSLDLDTDSIQSINRSVSECEGLETDAQLAEEVVSSFHQFTKQKNIALFQYLLVDVEDRRSISGLRFGERGWSIAESAAKQGGLGSKIACSKVQQYEISMYLKPGRPPKIWRVRSQLNPAELKATVIEEARAEGLGSVHVKINLPKKTPTKKRGGKRKKTKRPSKSRSKRSSVLSKRR